MSTLTLAQRLEGSDPRLRRRRRLSGAISGLSTLAALIAVGLLAAVLVSVAAKGAPALSANLFLHSEVPFGAKGGGIANALVGTLVLIALASAFAIPLGILVAVYSHEFASPRAARAVRFCLDVLAGVPTIVVGIFVFAALVVGSGQSGLAGAIALAIVMVPIVGRAAQEVLSAVPSGLREGGLALGVPRWKVVLRLLLPSAAGGLLTGALLAVARAAGETAPLLFTSAIFSAGISVNPGKALASVPLRIFQLAEANSPEEHAEAWAAALILIVFVLLLNLLARFFYSRLQKRMGG